MGIGRAVIAAGIVASSTAHAGPVAVDWGGGNVTVRATGIADRHAPSPAAAREPARRAAEDAARAQLIAAVPALALAAGGSVADKLTDRAIKARIDRAIASALVISADPETDGAWRVTLGLPIDAIRTALTGPRRLEASGDRADVPPIVVVEGVRATPAIGWIVDKLPAATVWVTEIPSWAKDAPRVQATAATAGAITTVDAAGHKAAHHGTAATLFVLVTVSTGLGR